MSLFAVRLRHPPQDFSISEACAEAIRVSDLLGIDVEFEYFGFPIIVVVGSSMGRMASYCRARGIPWPEEQVEATNAG